MASPDPRAELEETLQQLRQELAAAKELTRRTTFPELLELAHKNYTERLRVETDRSLTTQGSITSTKGKKHPKYLKPWVDFPQLQQKYFDEAYKILCEDAEAFYFTPRIALEEEGRAVCDRALTTRKIWNAMIGPP
jgi:hypothetical protein